MTFTYTSSAGSYFPTGATVSDAGVNFSVFSRHATGAELLLYEAAGSPEPFQIIRLHPKTNRSFFFWHVFVEGLPAGTHYTWRTFGPSDTAATGRRFNPKKELVDPWAKAVTDVFWDRRRASDPNDESRSSYRGVAAKRTICGRTSVPVNGGSRVRSSMNCMSEALRATHLLASDILARSPA